MRRFGFGFNENAKLTPWVGMFAQEVFDFYDVDRNGQLTASELASMLRDHGMCLDYTGANRVLELIAGAGAQSIAFDDFARWVLRLVERRRGTGGQAAEVLRCVFCSYDVNKSGKLEMQEYSQFLTHVGYRARTKEEWDDQSTLVASCREDGLPGSLKFPEFVILARKINDRNQKTLRRSKP